MNLRNIFRQHWAALRALLVLTAITGFVYPVAVWGVSLLPGLHANAEGSIVKVAGPNSARKAVGSKLIGQSFTDKDGNPLKQYFQSRPSAAGTGYDPTASGATNLGPESVIDTPDKPSLLTQVCSRSAAIGRLEKVDGSRPFCTGDGVGAVLSVIGPRDSAGNVMHPTRVVSVNQPCAKPGSAPAAVFQQIYEGVRVQCAQLGQDYSAGQIVPIRGAAPEHPAVPADAVTASGSGLDPDISPAYAGIQVARVAGARGVTTAQVLDAVHRNQRGRPLGVFGEPVVNVVALNLELDRDFPVKS